MIICSFDTPTFNMKSGTLYILSHRLSKKNIYNRQRDFS